jgi:MFS transporter, PAT family, beta-lactamase induction signal transducer AmpG
MAEAGEARAAGLRADAEAPAALPQPPERPGALRSLRLALTSWRTASVVLLSFSSGMPLGLVWIAIPDWMRSSGADLRVVGLFTLAQAPWTFKVLWAPIMDRWSPPLLQRFGRRRGWALLTQIALALATFALAGLGHRPEAPWVALALTFAIAVAAASQDIAVDAYAVDVLRPDEQGIAVGARIALYRAGMFLAGGLAITLAAWISWPGVCVLLGLLFVPMMVVSITAPEPPDVPGRPVSLRQAVWQPFLGFLSRHRALEILAFVLLYKLCDNFAQALLRPFLFDMGYDEFHRGFALNTVGTVGIVGGAMIGGALTNVMGLGNALWIFGLLQIFSNLGYVLLANIPTNNPAMYGAMGFENLTQGLGTGAFSVLLLRLTQKRFSAAQYALLSAFFGIPRVISGPITGVTVDAIGWSWFFVLTMPLGVPGLVMLWRFVRPGQREVTFEVRDAPDMAPPSRGELTLKGVLAGGATLAGGMALMALLGALKAMRQHPEEGFRYGAALGAMLDPATVGAWLQLAALLACAMIAGVFGAAAVAARRGVGRELVDPTSPAGGGST